MLNLENISKRSPSTSVMVVNICPIYINYNLKRKNRNKLFKSTGKLIREMRYLKLNCVVII